VKPRGFEGRLPCGRWSVWRYNWLPNHKLVAALERVRRHARGTLLDVGCGSRPFAPLFRGHAERYLGLDLPSSPDLTRGLPDVYADAMSLPVRGGSVDTVLSLSMFDLVPDPWQVLGEMKRVLAPGGVIIAEFVQAVPVYRNSPDLWRFTRPGVERLLADAGLEPVEIIALGGLPGYAGSAAIAALNRLNRGPWRVITELPVRLLYVLIQSVAELLDRLGEGSSEAMAYVVVARVRP
jgi:SAM-dependent methyltransferase